MLFRNCLKDTIYWMSFRMTEYGELNHLRWRLGLFYLVSDSDIEFNFDEFYLANHSDCLVISTKWSTVLCGKNDPML